MHADHSHDEDPVQVCVLLYTLPACTHIIHFTELPRHAGTPHHLCLHVARPKHPSSSLHPPSLPLPLGATEKLGPRPLDVISITSYSDLPPPPHHRRSARRRKIHTTQFMAHILILSLPPGARMSDYALVEQRPLSRSSGKGMARATNNSGSNELMHVLKTAFESSWYGPGSTNTSPREKRRTRRRTKKTPAKEVVVVDDDEDEEEGTVMVNLPASLDQALAAAFSLNSANPNVAATASPSARAQVPPAAGGSTRRLRRDTWVESLSDSAMWRSSSRRRRKLPHARSCPNVLEREKQSLACSAMRMAAQKGKTTLHITPTSSPRNQRRRVALPRDPAEPDDSDDE